jgi:hypothetical protein
MISNKFFDKFPLMDYRGANCVNIMERVALLQSVHLNPYVYYPYDVQDNERADQFANRYYGDPFESWILYLTNQIYDPLREWYLPADELNTLINEKYGSLQAAYQKTKFFRHDWENAEPITPSAYNALTPLLQAYWQPQTTGYRITSYTRRHNDWTVNTNRVIAYNVVNTAFQTGEVVDIVFNSDTTGEGQVLSVDSSTNTVFLQHVNGNYIETTSYLQNEDADFVLDESSNYIVVEGDSYIYGRESSVNTAFGMYSNGSFMPSRIISENLDPSEEVYWTSVSYYDYENESNEFNKTIRVLDSRYATSAVKNLTDLLEKK